ncbi:MAG: hypothetical protein GY898_24515 [Proteobacteria bacterium]|nr:hypothetical protein [Pseudomonadota bacterium]
MHRWAALAAAVLLLASVGTAAADEGAWTPDDGVRTDQTRTPPRFEGMEYLFPLRIHLTRGGHLDGGLGGYDPTTGQLLLVLKTATLEISTHLVEAVTPLGPLPAADSDAASAAPPPMLTRDHVEYKLRPSWRSGLGLGLSFVMPGLGQFIQEDRKEVGLLFLGGAAFFVAGGLLALFAPSSYPQRARAIVAGVMFGLSGTVAIGAGVHAWNAGKRRVAVEIKGAPKGSVD